jgi:GAF domain-containing protein
MSQSEALKPSGGGSPSSSLVLAASEVNAAAAAVVKQPSWPVWYHPSAPIGSAVRYLSGLSSKFQWVGVYILRDGFLELGPFIGDPSPHSRIRVGEGVCGTAVAENRDQNVPDVRACDNYLACSLETRSELVVLVRDSGGRILGQIDIDSSELAAFGPEEEEVVRRVARELGELWPA